MADVAVCRVEGYLDGMTVARFRQALPDASEGARWSLTCRTCSSSTVRD
jgi:hypothetical protein